MVDQRNSHRPGLTGFCRWRPVPACISLETTGSPTFLGNPKCAFALLSDPGGSMTSGQYDVSILPPLNVQRRPPHLFLSRLSNTASALAVYASQCRLPDPTQDSLPAAGQTLPNGLPTGRVPTKGFDPLSTSLPLSQASWRKHFPFELSQVWILVCPMTNSMDFLAGWPLITILIASSAKFSPFHFVDLPILCTSGIREPRSDRSACR